MGSICFWLLTSHATVRRNLFFVCVNSLLGYHGLHVRQASELPHGERIIVTITIILPIMPISVLIIPTMTTSIVIIIITTTTIIITITTPPSTSSLPGGAYNLVYALKTVSFCTSDGSWYLLRQSDLKRLLPQPLRVSKRAAKTIITLVSSTIEA